MKTIYSIWFLFIIPSIANCSITKKRDWTWNIICNPNLIVQVRALPGATSFNPEKGTISDQTHKHSNLWILIAAGVAQSIEQKELSKNRTAFLISTAMTRYLALVYDPEKPETIDFHDINQPSKIFNSDPQIVKELKQLLPLQSKSTSQE